MLYGGDFKFVMGILFVFSIVMIVGTIVTRRITDNLVINFLEMELDRRQQKANGAERGMANV